MSSATHAASAAFRHQFRSRNRAHVLCLAQFGLGQGRGGKLDAYRAVPSVREVVLVRQDRRAATAYRRDDAGRWTIEDVGGAGTLALESVGVDVPMDAVYEGTAVGG